MSPGVAMIYDSRVNPASLSKSDCLDSPVLASWEPGYRVQWRHADAAFAVADWACDGRHRSSHVDAETPRFFELHVQRCGWHRRRLGRRELVIDPLHVGLWPQAQTYDLLDHVGRRQSAMIWFLSPALIESALAERPGASTQDWRRIASAPCLLRDPALTLPLARLQRCGAQEPLLWQETMQLLLDHLFTAASGRADAEASLTAANAHRIIDAKRYVCAHYTDALSLNQIAAAVNLSPSRLSVLFRQGVGQSLWSYVRDLRLQAALHRLPDGRRQLSALALDLGFASHSHLTQAFRKRFGLAPAQAFATPSERR